MRCGVSVYGSMGEKWARSTHKNASRTRSLLMRPCLKRLETRSVFVAPEHFQLILIELRMRESIVVVVVVVVVVTNEVQDVEEDAFGEVTEGASLI